MNNVAQDNTTIKMKQQQQGFVLILALVMLGVLTLIGVSSMNTANMELRATSNARQHQIAFNASSSIHEYILSDPGAVEIDYLALVPNNVPNYTLAGAKDISATVTKVGCSISIGSSLEEGKSFSSNYFSIIGTGSNLSGTATSIQVQGVRYPAAGC